MGNPSVGNAPQMREPYPAYAGSKPPPSQYEEPLSFETAVAVGRGGRQLPSPLPNGYKPGQRGREPTAPILSKDMGPRHSDSDEDDWC